MKQLISIKVNQETLDKIKDYYSSYLVNNDGEYVYFAALKSGIVITGFCSKKESKTVTFNGDNALAEAQIWEPTATVMEQKAKEKSPMLVGFPVNMTSNGSSSSIYE